MIKTTLGEELELISRPGLARRWKCHPESLKRREKKGLLHPIALSARMIRYRMNEVLALEAEAAGYRAGTNVKIPGRFTPDEGSQGAARRQKKSSNSSRKHTSGGEVKRARKLQKEPPGVIVNLD
jgi:hypothetical protein